MNKYAQNLLNEISVRIVLILLSVLATWFFIDRLEKNDNLTWLNTIQTTNAEAAKLTEKWLESRLDFAQQLATNPQIIKAVTSVIPTNIKKDLNKIAYDNEIIYLYIYSFQKDKIIAKPSDAPKIPLHVLGIIKDAATARQENLTTAFIYAGKTYIFATTAIFNDSGIVVGYTAFFEPIKQALKTLTAMPDNNPLFEVSLVKLSPNGQYGILRNFNRIVSELESIPVGKFHLPLFIENNFSGTFVDDYEDEILATGYIVDNFPSWQVITTIETNKIPRQTDKLRNIVIIFAAFVIVILLLLPTRGRYSDLLYKGYKKINIAPEKFYFFSKKEVKKHNFLKNEKELSQVKTAQAVQNKHVLEDHKKKILQDGKATDSEISYFIRRGMKQGKFKLLYQPVVNLADNKIVMHEVYMRLIDEEGELLPPSIWLPVAKKENLFSLIDESVLSMAISNHFSEYNPLNFSEHNPLAAALAYNISGDTFDSFSYLETLMNNITKNGEITQKTIFELHSTEVIDDPKTLAFIKECREMGFRFSIDYFGGGAKTVKATKALKFDFLKLNALDFNLKNKEDIKKFITIVKTAESVGLQIIVEKVESQTMLNLCKKLKYPYVQGYIISKPLGEPKDNFTEPF